jgi:hypothetical protein
MNQEDSYGSPTGPNVPDWWRPFNIRDESNPAVAATLMMNAAIGSGNLSPENARSLAEQMYVMWGTNTGDNPWDIYSAKFDANKPTDPANDPFGGPRLGNTFDPQISNEQALLGQTGPGVINEDYYNRNTAQGFLDAFSAMREATVGGNIDKLGNKGAAYAALQEIAAGLGSAGDANTRAKKLQVLGDLDPKLAMFGGGDLAGYAPLAQMMASPFYTNLPPSVSRDQSGNYQFGSPSKYLVF